MIADWLAFVKEKCGVKMLHGGFGAKREGKRGVNGVGIWEWLRDSRFGEELSAEEYGRWDFELGHDWMQNN